MSTFGTFEATVIYWLVKGLEVGRPLTHAAMAKAIAALGGAVRSIVIDRPNDRYHAANVRVAQFAAEVNIDMRPSDAIALALNAGAHIYTIPNKRGDDSPFVVGVITCGANKPDRAKPHRQFSFASD